MEPTLKVGQRILADRIGMSISGPHVGEIVVFTRPREPIRKAEVKAKLSAAPPDDQ